MNVKEEEAVISTLSPRARNAYNLLSKMAKKGGEYSYSELYKAIGLRMPDDRFEGEDVLAELSSATFNKFGFMITVLVNNKNTGKLGKGFFTLADKLKAKGSSESEQEFIKRQIKSCYEHFEFPGA